MNKTNNDIQCCVTHCERPLDQSYWNTQWETNTTGWDIGYASPAITKFMEGYANKKDKILIPGCGNAYEAEFLLSKGFSDITLIDIAQKAVEMLKEKFAGKQQVNVLCEDFFQHQGNYDIIIEQTFFCAIPPVRRNEYVKKAASLLNDGGRIIGLLFDRTFEQQGPPFGGCPCEYKPIFNPDFVINKMEKCHNSIPQRADTELFIHLIKK